MYKKTVRQDDEINEILKENSDMNTASTQTDIEDLDAVLAQIETPDQDPETYTLEADASTDVTEIEAEAETVATDELDDLGLDDLDLSGADEAEAIEATKVLEADELRDLDLALERQESYQEQTAAAVVTVEKQPAGAGAKKTAKSTRGSAVPRAARDLNSVAPEYFVLSGDAAALDATALTQAKTDTIALKPGQVKIAEKFENLFTAVAAGKLPSIYTMVAFRLLDANKAITSADLIAAYKTSLTNCGEGTARSQCGQLMNLLSAVKIADRSGNTLVLRSDSLLAERIRELEKPAAAAAAA
jgi:hypothetical protein